MPDKHGRFRPVSFPVAPWCACCKLFACACEPASKPLPAVGAPAHGTATAPLGLHLQRGTAAGVGCTPAVSPPTTAPHPYCGSSRCCGAC